MSSSFQAQALISVVICALIVLCVLTTPLGLFVVPLVNKIIARRSGRIPGSLPASSVKISSTDNSWIFSVSHNSRNDSWCSPFATIRVTLALVR